MFQVWQLREVAVLVLCPCSHLRRHPPPGRLRLEPLQRERQRVVRTSSKVGIRRGESHLRLSWMPRVWMSLAHLLLQRRRGKQSREEERGEEFALSTTCGMFSFGVGGVLLIYFYMYETGNGHGRWQWRKIAERIILRRRRQRSDSKARDCTNRL